MLDQGESQIHGPGRGHTDEKLASMIQTQDLGEQQQDFLVLGVNRRRIHLHTHSNNILGPVRTDRNLHGLWRGGEV